MEDQRKRFDEYMNIFNDELQRELDTYYNYGDDLLTKYYHKLRIINFKRLFTKIKLSPNAKVLDIGCGCGIYTILLAESGSNVVGIDVSDKDIRAAISWARSKKSRHLLFFKADAEHLPFKDNSFDFIVCSEVFEHLNDPFRGLQEFSRVLKTDGEGMISMPNLFSLKFLKGRLVSEVNHLFKNMGIDPHYKFSFIKIKKMIRDAGLLIGYSNSVGCIPIRARILRFCNKYRLLNLIARSENVISGKGFSFGAFYFVVVKKR